MAVMTEAEKVSELHQDVKNNLVNEDVEKVKNWQKEAYHKQMIGGFKEAKEAEEGFKKAQKPWAKKLKEVRQCFIPVECASLPYKQGSLRHLGSSISLEKKRMKVFAPHVSHPFRATKIRSIRDTA